ncbi:hypothetical protein [Peptoniphilus indolicus]|uniref:Uncharacterized protein n=2 Tax=Peptoniphilus indolicus TaxID=33030 RepID=G4D2E6_9FIRM|nr:hypothetical protein [Peptoniphilus indolicus]EGY80300.1 hypothetical protein HMPREF9129_0576 [Peptoniphilus indolicus ATCC 29427]SUB75344.1 Uncharacterised protein [Peptoniphilus indolicus]
MGRKKKRDFFKKLVRVNIILSSIGVLLLVLLVIFDVAYPNPWFTILSLCAIVLIFLALILWGLVWINDVVEVYKINKKLALLMLVVGIIFIVYEFFIK